MSGLINKAKDLLHGNKEETHHSSNLGPHDSNYANKADPRVDSNDPTQYGSNTGSGYGTTGHTGHSTNTGPHSSNLANKADPRIDSDGDHRRDPTSRVGGYGSNDPTQYGQSTSGYGTTGHTGHSTNTGPHSSNLANKADPRIDSDYDGRADPTSRVGGYGSNDPTQYGQSTGGYGSSNTGPHSSNLANKADPRVDSDRSQFSGGQGYNTGSYGTGTTGQFGSGTTGGYGGSNTAGPHNSNLANKLDPRVDDNAGGYSSQYGSGTTGHTTHQGQHGHAPVHDATTHGYGDSGIGSGTTGGYGTSTSTGASGTAGPHNSNLLNKLDPRVDSDRDNSKTFGGNKTNY
ncbi:hypothetical protein H2198_005472 [Neophaeococcomyces mojaviensis]|uniref:Uncharacterized protein n=1 Tax=Neophaeococcomyces mojaviensis TaxID=3383035 RepID=A0ACC3A5N9_9EURO|nr:hypothetical protein H2198_005472 [Knufia sp. JES_112]